MKLKEQEKGKLTASESIMSMESFKNKLFHIFLNASHMISFRKSEFVCVGGCVRERERARERERERDRERDRERQSKREKE